MGIVNGRIPMTNQTIGSILRTAREAKGLSMRELADNVGASKSHIGMMESNDRTPSLVMVIRLAEALELQPSDLLSPLVKDQESA